MTSDGIRYSNIEPDQEISAAPLRDRRDGTAEAEPVARRDVALGDRDEAREPRLGGEQIVAARVERALRHAIADREQLALGIEQEAEVHCRAPSSRAVASSAARRAVRAAAASGDGSMSRRWLSIERRAAAIQNSMSAPASSPRSLANARGDVGHGLGLRGELRQALRRCVASPVSGCRTAAASAASASSSCVPGHGLRAPAVAQLVRRLTREVERVGDAGQALRGRRRRGRSTPGRRWRARSGGRPGCRCRPRRRSAARAGAGRCVSYQL